MLGAGEDADPAAVRSRVVAGVLERLPGALEEQPLLRVDQLGLARAVAEEAGVEELDAVEHAARPARSRVGRERLAATPAARSSSSVKKRDRLDAVAQVAPEARRRPRRRGSGRPCR